jgi:hypothetical protein
MQLEASFRDFDENSNDTPSLATLDDNSSHYNQSFGLDMDQTYPHVDTPNQHFKKVSCCCCFSCCCCSFFSAQVVVVVAVVCVSLPYCRRGENLLLCRIDVTRQCRSTESSSNDDASEKKYCAQKLQMSLIDIQIFVEIRKQSIIVRLISGLC